MHFHYIPGFMSIQQGRLTALGKGAILKHFVSIPRGPFSRNPFHDSLITYRGWITMIAVLSRAIICSMSIHDSFHPLQSGSRPPLGHHHRYSSELTPNLHPGTSSPSHAEWPSPRTAGICCPAAPPPQPGWGAAPAVPAPRARWLFAPSADPGRPVLPACGYVSASPAPARSCSHGSAACRLWPGAGHAHVMLCHTRVMHDTAALLRRRWQPAWRGRWRRWRRAACDSCRGLRRCGTARTIRMAAAAFATPPFWL
jgi:hypothetical protein